MKLDDLSLSTKIYLISIIKEGINQRLDRKFQAKSYELFARYHRGEIDNLELADFLKLLENNALEHYELAEKTVERLENQVYLASPESGEG